MGALTPYIGVLEAHPNGATMATRKTKSAKRTRRTFTKEFKQEAVQMLLDGHSASSVSKNLGVENTNLIYRWKAELIDEGDCTEYACLFAALCRTQSIPARRVLVFNLSKHKKRTFTSPNHHIAEVYLNSHGWIPADANLGKGKYDRAIGLGKLGNTFILLNREGASNWSARIPKDGYDKSKPEPTKKSDVTWDAEVLKEGQLSQLEAEFNSESGLEAN